MLGIEAIVAHISIALHLHGQSHVSRMLITEMSGLKFRHQKMWVIDSALVLSEHAVCSVVSQYSPLGIEEVKLHASNLLMSVRRAERRCTWPVCSPSSLMQIAEMVLDAGDIQLPSKLEDDPGLAHYAAVAAAALAVNKGRPAAALLDLLLLAGKRKEA